MSEDQTVTIEVDGRELQAQAGAMLIDVTDAAGINIPRFCYHKKLSVSANCRMCLVEVEKVWKPLPACATPVADGMKVFTRSPMALAAQKGTMEFLLINHPLDCPICDQGGECELQDVAVGYGSDVSRFVEGKRVVKDKDIGPLVATDLTRCIHCTRCVRFGAEIAGIRELGATGRGEHMTIGTYIEKSVDSELSGNIIDVCPVGSLTSKPFRFHARAWELVQRESIAPHDSVGSSVNVHVRRNEVMRVVPCDNEAVNECWISDRDRFSYTGLASEERLTRPMIKQKNGWMETSWHDALNQVAQGLKDVAGEQLGALVSPSATLEEMHLAQKLVTGLGSSNIDYRLRQGDFRGQESAYPWLGQSIEALETLNAALLIGSNVRKEQPILGHRLRKAAVAGANISFINPMELDMNYASSQLVNTPAGMVDDLAAVAKAQGASGDIIDSAEVGDAHKAVAEQLKTADNASVLLGNIAVAHPDYSLLCSLAAKVAETSGAKLGFLPEAANSTGARLAIRTDGLNATAMLEHPRKGYLLMGVEPAYDFYNPALATTAFDKAEFVVALTVFRSPTIEAAADVMLPISSFGETSGTYVNAEGTWQSFAGAVSPKGETRPAWKVLRVLGNMLDIDGFDQDSSVDVFNEVKETAGDRQPDNTVGDATDSERKVAAGGLTRIGDVPLYAIDPLVRRAAPLQQTKDAISASIRLNAREATRGGFAEGDRAVVVQDGNRAVLPIEIDPNVPDSCVRVPAGLAGTEMLGGQFGEVTLEKA
ncbi:NADH-quinone oxidoreductase subunit NuoG [Solemya velesiana gill symbiont]|uniref:NADH-quinone oxidoreductase n=1 Tax=Solemya velesiana gill symbiont TaxID=1918948 RepID=A0A1T2KVW3_9GAMM|nr:NADH-quinone oxidoreductase subunit NuoG [Solemya velesiana gill symbiont]OOZ36964.1 NADH-quinone oxidoreductase subunit G [Solemya velesiana gill symbiont]